MTVQPFDDEDEAVAPRERHAFGLGASVWSRDSAARARWRRASTPAWCGRTTSATRTAAGRRRGAAARSPGFGRTHSKHGLYELLARQARRLGQRPRRRCRGGTRTARARSTASKACSSCCTATDALRGARSVDAPARPRASREALPAPMSELSHVARVRRGPDGGRRREAALAPPRGRVGARAHGAGRPRAPARAAEGRRARRRRSSPGSWRRSGRRADPALSSAAAHAHRRGRCSSRTKASRSPPPSRRRRRPASRWRR